MNAREAFEETIGTALERIGSELEAIGDLLTLAIVNPADLSGVERMRERLQDRLIRRAIKQIDRDQRGEA